MISSAVIVPENEAASTSPNLKRRQSSISDESNKRPRLESNNDLLSSPGKESSNDTTSSPTKRRTSAFGAGLGVAEEKKRGQRLFGSLLGTLSQKSTRPVHKKRDEIEARQRERLKRDDEEREGERRRKKAELDRIRKEEQKDWEGEGMKLRHRNMRATAGFLRTKSEPRLYYKPWEWRQEEEEQVARQKKEVEERIRNELAAVTARRTPEMSTDPETHPPLASELPIVEGENPIAQRDPSKDEETNLSNHFGEVGGANTEEAARDVDNSSNNQGETTNGSSRTQYQEKHNHDDHHGEELVEGQEDDVIY